MQAAASRAASDGGGGRRALEQAPRLSLVVAACVCMACLRGLGFERNETSSLDVMLLCRTLQVLVQKLETM